MPSVNIRCRENGPLIVEGEVTLTDHQGNRFVIDTIKPSLALCRCGGSKNKPFCDGEHRGADFQAAELAPSKS